MKFIVLLCVFALIGLALYQKWRRIPAQTKQMWGMLFGMAGAVREAKKQMREQGNAAPYDQTGERPFERTTSSRENTASMQACAQCGLYVTANEGVQVGGQFYCCQEHAR